MRLIDADELVSKIDELSEGAGFYKPIYEGFSKAVKNQPTIDAVPVVRCKGCAYFSSEEIWCVHEGNMVLNIGKTVYPNDFCSFGEWKDGEP
jgi:hypothetical protein